MTCLCDLFCTCIHHSHSSEKPMCGAFVAPKIKRFKKRKTTAHSTLASKNTNFNVQLVNMYTLYINAASMFYAMRMVSEFGECSNMDDSSRYGVMSRG